MGTYHIIDNVGLLQKTFDYLNRHKGIVALDTETSSVDTRSCIIMGVSLAIQEGEAFYFVLNEYNGGLWSCIDSKAPGYATIFKNLLNEFLAQSQIVCHNAAYDVIVLRKTIGIDILPYLYMDTMLMKHLADEERPHGLKETAAKWLGVSYENTEVEELKRSVLANGGKFTKTDKDIYKADAEILGLYAAKDADITLQLFYKLYNALEKDNLLNFYFEETHPLLKVTINHLLERGVYCDIEYFKQLKVDLSTKSLELERAAHTELSQNYAKEYNSLEIEVLEKEFPLTKTGAVSKYLLQRTFETLPKKTLATKLILQDAYEHNPQNPYVQWRLGIISDADFILEATDIVYEARKALYAAKHSSPYVVNLQSTLQVKRLLFEKLGETPLKQTKKGGDAIDESVLEHFSTTYEWIKYLLEYRKLNKLISTYIDSILDRNKNGIVYPDWLMHGTTSGRYSCQNPNFMNIPSEDKRIKQGIIARPGYVLVGVDYAQLEPRCFASISSEPRLIDAFNNKEDFYGNIAKDIYGLDCSPNEVKEKYPQERQYIKQVALGIPYGLRKWKLSSILQCSLEDAQAFIDKFWKTYPKLYQWVKKSHGEAIKNQRIACETGRLRRFKDLKRLQISTDKDDFRLFNTLLNLAVNHQIQGLAASIMNRASINIAEEIEQRGFDASVVMQIHDELVIECKEEQSKYVAELVKKAMENAYTLKVPLIAEPKIASKLSETK